jgi:hypothetical protein
MMVTMPSPATAWACLTALTTPSVTNVRFGAAFSRTLCDGMKIGVWNGGFSAHPLRWSPRSKVRRPITVAAEANSSSRASRLTSDLVLAPAFG